MSDLLAVVNAIYSERNRVKERLDAHREELELARGARDLADARVRDCERAVNEYDVLYSYLDEGLKELDERLKDQKKNQEDVSDGE